MTQNLTFYAKCKVVHVIISKKVNFDLNTCKKAFYGVTVVILRPPTKGVMQFFFFYFVENQQSYILSQTDFDYLLWFGNKSQNTKKMIEKG